MHIRRSVLIPLLAASAVLAGCQDELTPVSIPPATRAVQTGTIHSTGPRSPFGRFRPGEEHSVELAGEIPGFGGFYIDSVGNFHAYLVDVRQAASGRAAFARILAERQRGYTDTERLLRPHGRMRNPSRTVYVLPARRLAQQHRELHHEGSRRCVGRVGRARKPSRGRSGSHPA